MKRIFLALILVSLSLAYVLPPDEEQLSRTNRQYSEPCIWKCGIIACITAPCPPCIWRCEPIPTPPPTIPCYRFPCPLTPDHTNPGPILQGGNNDGYDFGNN